MRKIRIWICIFALFLARGVSLYAAEADVFDKEHECTITADTKTARLAGESLAVYKVAEVDYTVNSLVYTWIDDLKNPDIDMEKLINGSAREKEAMILILQQAVEESGGIMPLDVKTFDSTGKIEYTVEPGMYLIVQVNKVKATVQTTLTSVPVMNEEGDGWSYEAVTEPKYRIPGQIPETGDDELRAQIMRYAGIALMCASGAGILILIKCGFGEKGAVCRRSKTG